MLIRTVVVVACVLAVVSMNSAGVSAVQSKEEFVKVKQYSLGATSQPQARTVAASSDGVALLSDFGSHGLFEAENGRVVREYSFPGHRPLRADFGPSGERYILFVGANGGLVAVYDHQGRKIKDILCKGMGNPKAFSVDSEGRILVFATVGDLPSSPSRGVLQKFDRQGRLYAEHMSEVLGPLDRQILLVAGESDEVAVFRPDEKAVYWLDGQGNKITTVPLADTFVTAIGLVKGTLFVAIADQTRQPSESGVFAYGLSKPRLIRATRDKLITELTLPDEALGIGAIDRHGNLLKSSPTGIEVYAIKAP